MSTTNIIAILFIVVNTFSFLVMADDKRKSVRSNSSSRTPEGVLFFLASAFGAAGVYAGMILLRHKTKHWYFQLGIPLLVIENVAAVYAISTLL